MFDDRVERAQGVEVLEYMDGISIDSAPIIRAYIDLNLETLYNVRPPMAACLD